LLKQRHLNQTHIHQKIQDIQENLDHFEDWQAKISQSLRSVSNLFETEEDRTEHNEKIDAFCSLFMDIYCDIDDIINEYHTYLNIPKK